jgi:hypothetical protein
MCTKGSQMTYCVSYGPGNTCSSITYKHDGVTASCACSGGSSCTDAYYTAYTDCQDAVGACNDLDNCCDTIDATYTSTCRTYVSTYQGQNYGDVSCKSVLSSWQSSGLCP